VYSLIAIVERKSVNSSVSLHHRQRPQWSRFFCPP